MVKIDDFVVTSVAYNITEMSNEQLQKLATMLSGSVGESLCDYLTLLSKMHKFIQMKIWKWKQYD